MLLFAVGLLFTGTHNTATQAANTTILKVRYTVFERSGEIYVRSMTHGYEQIISQEVEAECHSPYFSQDYVSIHFTCASASEPVYYLYDSHGLLRKSNTLIN